MGYIGGATKAQQATGPRPTQHTLTPAAAAFEKKLLDMSKSGGGMMGGGVSSTQMNELMALQQKMGPADLRSLRDVAADQARAQWQPLSTNKDPTVAALAKSSIKLIDNGYLPGGM